MSDPSMDSFGYFSGAMSNGRLLFAVLNLCSAHDRNVVAKKETLL